MVIDGLGVGAPAVPQNSRAEAALLGALLIDPACFGDLDDVLRPEDFGDARHRRIYEAIAAVDARSEAVDYITVVTELERGNVLAEVGGAAALTSLVNYAPTSLHARHYAGIIAETGRRRRLLGAAAEIARVASGEDSVTGDVLARAEEVLFEVDAGRASGEVVSVRDALNGFFDEVEREQRSDDQGAVGLRTGFVDLDKVTAGLKPGDLVLVAARPSVGKSAFATNVARNVATDQGIGVLVFSLEMSVSQIVARLVASEASVDAQRFRLGYTDEFEWRRISEAYDRLKEMPLWFDDTATATLAHIRSRSRRFKARHDIGLIVVDYLQLISTPPAGRGENRTTAVGEISRGLKALARELEVPVVALSQLSRALESRQDHRPMLSDLRESGSLEQDADVVMFLHREELFNPNTDRRNIADLIVAKNRSGPTATIPLRWFPGNVRFADLEVYRQEGF